MQPGDSPRALGQAGHRRRGRPAPAAPACDGVIVIVRHGKTRADHVRRAAESLAGVGSQILGSVLSMVPGGRHPDYGYGYGYRRYRQRQRGPVRKTPDSEQQAGLSLDSEIRDGERAASQSHDSEGPDGEWPTEPSHAALS